MATKVAYKLFGFVNNIDSLVQLVIGVSWAFCFLAEELRLI